MIGSLIVAADQLTKRAVVAAFHPGESLPLISPVLHLTYVQNTGAAFGLFKGQQLFFIITSLLVIAWVVWELLARPVRSQRVLWGCALIWGGAVGNVMDRVRLGYVIDFLDLRVWPVFNVGDSAITIGVGLLILHMLRTPSTSRLRP